jgi:hypothetical protein
MSKLTLRISLVLLLLSCSKLSYSAILIEPHLGFNLKGSADYNGNASAIVSGQRVNVATSFSDKYNGLQYGARLGLQYTPGIMFGFDYNRSNFTIKSSYTDGSAPDKDSYTRSEYGAFLGASLPFSLRLWYGYYIMELETSKTNSVSGATKGDTADGNTSEIGVGFAGFPFMSFNLLYRMMTYKDGNSETIGAYTLTPKYKSKEIVLGVSIPITL